MIKMIRRRRRYAFTCGHCDRPVPWQGSAIGECNGPTRNACPSCHWSKHVQLGVEVGKPPCGQMMSPHLMGDSVTHRCTGCGFIITGPAEQAIDRIGWGAFGESAAWSFHDGPAGFLDPKSLAS